MVENSKHVRVDNWGIFFLQRLQMFFSKTDYCDLTLQFEGNVQLKVHRLVMNVCTEYFQILEMEQAAENNLIVMPEDLQADVIVPIVNFMYTGTLQFQTTLFEKLYKAAHLMNITVLTKLLDAQRKNLNASVKPSTKKPPLVTNLSQQSKKDPLHKTIPTGLSSPSSTSGRRSTWKKRNFSDVLSLLSQPSSQCSAPLKTTKCASADPLFLPDNTPKPTRFEWPDDDDSLSLPGLNLMDTSFDDISYTSKPLLTEEYETKAGRHLTKSLSSQNSEKKRIQSEVASGDEESSIIVESIEVGNKRKAEKILELSPKKIKTSEKQSPIVHTKLITEILKKYPQLVKQNKNIRLKILPKGIKGSSPEIKEAQNVKITSELKVAKKIDISNDKLNEYDVDNSKSAETWICPKCSTKSELVEFALYYLYRKHMIEVHHEKFDSTICNFCGFRSKSEHLLSYHLYVKHGIKPASNVFLSCDRCPYVALTEAQMKKHKPKHTPHEKQCVECLLTFTNKLTLMNHMQSTGHSGKLVKNIFNCQFCVKKYQTVVSLFSHIKSQHRTEAKENGIVSIDEPDEEIASQEDINVEYILPEIISEVNIKDNKVKILSNVKVSQEKNKQQAGLEASSEAEALNNVASGIATSLGLVDIVVLDENQQYILQTNNQQFIAESDQHEYILPEIADGTTFVSTTEEGNVISQNVMPSGDISSTDELVMVLTDHDYKEDHSEINNDNSNIVVLYSHPVEGEGQYITSQENLVVNQQTGLIEIRNGATIATTTAGQLMISNSQETHIESIEMIQREIENQTSEGKNERQTNDTEAEETVDKTNDSEVSTEAGIQEEHHSKSDDTEKLNEESLEKQEVVDEQEAIGDENIQVEESGHPVDEDISENKDADRVDETQDRIDETQEASTNVEVTETNPDESEAKTSEMTTEFICTEENENESEVQVERSEMNVELDSSENLYTEESEFNTSKETVESGEAPMEVEDSEDNNYSLNEESTNKEEGTRSEGTDMLDTSTEMVTSQESDGTLTQDTTDTENPDQTIENINAEISPGIPLSKQTDDEKSGKISDETAKISIEMELECEQNEDFEDQDSTKTCRSENEKINRECDEQVTSNEQEPNDDREPNDDQEPSNSTRYAESFNQKESSIGDVGKEENLAEVSFESQESQQSENIEESSQESQISEKEVEESKTNTTDMAKMSILDDWEDTDSQQSGENSDAIKIAGETVNKLMDEWEDDEDEDKNGSA